MLTMKQPQHSLDIELRMADIWRQKGKPARALAGYQKALLQQPENAEIHKRHIDVLTQTSGLEAAFAYYGLSRKDGPQNSPQDDRALEIASSDILCCVVVRNEALRLPFFLSYHRDRGISKFLVVDNGSTDDTLAYLQTQPDVYSWQSTESYKKTNFGSAWLELLLRQYGVGHWCLMVDADELFYYPECESKTIPQLCLELEKKKFSAYSTLLLDLYSEEAIKNTLYEKGQDFRDICPFFDKTFYHRFYRDATPYQNQTIYVGGLRERIFGKAGDYYLSKVPLLKYEKDCVLTGGQHWTNYPAYEIARERGALLHFKYLSGFAEYVQQEVVRKQHYGDGCQYVQYAQGLAGNPDLTLYSDEHSLRFEGSQQLVQLGVMQIDRQQSAVVEFPSIAPVAAGIHRPLWSVMITCHRPTYLAQTLKSLLKQAPAPEAMQIELVVDGVSAEVQAKIRAIAQDVGGDRLQIYTHPQKIGQPHIFNLAIQRAHGHWVHILHDDDWLAPGFYQALANATKSNAQPGLAFCRHRYMNQGQQRWMSRLEKPNAGVLHNWPEEIITFCHLQFSAVVVKRSAYEQVGGFCPQANTIADWEMWKRIAVHYPVWYEPEPLMYYREHPDSETSHLLRSGQQVADTRKTIFITRQYLPRAKAQKLSKAALENYALYAIDIAKQQLLRQDSEAAMANLKEATTNLKEALKCGQSAGTQQATGIQQTLIKALSPSKEETA